MATIMYLHIFFRLEWLNVSNNLLTALPKLELKTPIALKWLFLNRNLLTELAWDFILKASRLQVLRIAYNQIVEIPKGYVIFGFHFLIKKQTIVYTLARQYTNIIHTYL